MQIQMLRAQSVGIQGLAPLHRAGSLAQVRMISQLLAYQGTEDGEFVLLGKDPFEFGPAQDGSCVAEAEPADLGR